MRGSRSDRSTEAGSGWADVQAAAYDLSCRRQNEKAARIVAGQATDVDDCSELLAMLGLDVPRRHLG